MSKPAPAIDWLVKAAIKSVSLIIGPRDMLIIYEEGFIRANSGAATRFRVLSLSLTWIDTMSDKENSSSLETKEAPLDVACAESMF